MIRFLRPVAFTAATKSSLSQALIWDCDDAGLFVRAERQLWHDLFHDVARIEHHVFLNNLVILPFGDCGEKRFKALSGGCDRLAVARLHWFGERAADPSHCYCPLALAKLNIIGVVVDAHVREGRKGLLDHVTMRWSAHRVFRTELADLNVFAVQLVQKT